MLETLLGSVTGEQVLMFILARKEAYAREIARYYDTGLYSVQRQLDKFEAGRILASRKAGRTRLYVFNPAYPFLNELEGLLTRALSFYTKDEFARLTLNRRRPRRRGKRL